MFGEASETTLTRYAALRLRLDRDGRVIAIEGRDAGRLCPEEAEPRALRLDHLVAPPDRDTALQLLHSALRGVPERGVLRLRARTGVELWDVASVPVLAEDQVAEAWWLLWPLDAASQRLDWPRSAVEAAANAIAPQRLPAPAPGDLERSGLLVSSLRVGVLFEDVQRRIVQVNLAFCELFGFPGPEAITGSDCRQAVEYMKGLFVDPERFVSRTEELVRMRQPVLLEELELVDGRVLEGEYIPLDGLEGPIGHLWRYQDITERRSTERGLHDAEARYRELVEMLPAVVYQASAVDGIAPLYVSPQIERLLGYSVEEWAAGPQVWERSIHPEDRERVLEEIRHAVEEGRDQSLEYRLVARDGRIVWVRDEGRFVRDAAGRPLYIQGLMLDITARKEAEFALRQAEERYRLLVEQSPVMVYQAPADGVAEMAYVSPQIERLLGYTPAEWLTTRGNWASHLHPDDAAWVRAAVEQAIATEGRFRLEYRMRRKDGRIVWVQDHGMVLQGDPGQPAVVHGVMLDVTAQKEAEARLREAEARFRTLAEQLSAALIIVSADSQLQPDGVPGWRTYYVSPRIEAVTGYTPHEWETPGIWARNIHPEDRGHVLTLVDQATRAGEEFHLEYRFTRKDGRVIWLWHDSAVVRDDAGRPRYRHGLLLDITAQKETEARLAEAERRYRTLVEQLPAAVYLNAAEPVVLPDGTPVYPILYLSRQIAAITGYSPEELQSDPTLWPTLIHPDDRERRLAEIERTDRTGEPYRIEFRLMRRDGGAAWVLNQAELARDEAGRPLYWQGIIVDITQQKRVEAALREAEARYRTLVEQLPAAVYASVAEPLRWEDGELVYPILYVSPQIEAMTGYPPEEHLADPSLWVRLVHPDDRPRVAAELKRTDATGEPFRVEYRMLHRDGHVVWVLSSAELLRDESGQPLYWQGLLVDITQQKQTQAALHEAEQRYRTLIEQMPGAVVATEVHPVPLPAGEIAYPPIYVSPQFEVLTGYSAEEYQASPVLWYRNIHPNDRARVTAASLHTDETGEPFYAEYRFRRKDGEWIWLQERAVLVRDASGEPLYWHCLLLDVTEQKLAELTRQEAEVRYHTLVEQLPSAVIVTAAQPIVSPSGELHYPIVYISSRISDVTGFTPDEFRSTPGLWFQRIHPLDRERVRQEALRTDETGEPFRVEFRFQRKDGRWVWLENRALLVHDAEGRPQYWHGLFTDVTERKRSEMLLSGQLGIVERIAQQAPLSEVLEQLCRLVEEQAPDLLASVLLLDQEGRLRHGAAPSLPPDYVAAIEGLPIGPEQGSCGTAAYLGQPVVVSDTLSDPRWAKYRHLAQKYGLRACWSVPVFGSTGEVLATFALYAGEPRGPDDRERKLGELASQLAGLALERWREQEQLRYQAGHDLLTGLPNRSLFFDRLEHALARTARDPRQVAVLFIDLDGFKQVNDAFGHAAGDDLLAQVARRLQGSVRAGDTVARFAGDEFTVLLEDIQSLQEAITVAERMIRVLEKPFAVAGQTVRISASIGIADSRPSLTDPGALLLAADQALYAAKRAGKARYAVAP